jgi:hypothetical protein
VGSGVDGGVGWEEGEVGEMAAGDLVAGDLTATAGDERREI